MPGLPAAPDRRRELPAVRERPAQGSQAEERTGRKEAENRIYPVTAIARNTKARLITVGLLCFWTSRNAGSGRLPAHVGREVVITADILLTHQNLRHGIHRAANPVSNILLAQPFLDHVDPCVGHVPGLAQVLCRYAERTAHATVDGNLLHNTSSGNKGKPKPESCANDDSSSGDWKLALTVTAIVLYDSAMETPWPT